MSLCIIYSRKVYICHDHRAHRGLGLNGSEFTKLVVVFIFYFVVTVLHLLRALHQRIIVYRILYKIQRIRASLATANYDNKQSDCIL